MSGKDTTDTEEKVKAAERTSGKKPVLLLPQFRKQYRL